MSTFKVNPSDHTSPVVPIFSDKNRNGVLSIYALGRWCNLPKKLILKAIPNGNLGFIFATHTTFDDVSSCLYQSSWNSFVDISLSTTGYYTEYNTSSYFRAKHVKKQGRKSFIGHEISLAVAINRKTRKKKALTKDFKQWIDSNWNRYPNPLKSQYLTSKNKLSKHLNELKQIKMNKIKPLFSYKMQLRYIDEDRNYHLNSRKILSID
eukprot:UN12015